MALSQPLPLNANDKQSDLTRSLRTSSDRQRKAYASCLKARCRGITTNAKPTTFQRKHPLPQIRGPASASRKSHPQVVDEDEERSEGEADQAHNGQRGDLQRRQGTGGQSQRQALELKRGHIAEPHYRKNFLCAYRTEEKSSKRCRPFEQILGFSRKSATSKMQQLLERNPSQI
jgi:hypothetical protein